MTVYDISMTAWLVLLLDMCIWPGSMQAPFKRALTRRCSRILSLVNKGRLIIEDFMLLELFKTRRRWFKANFGDLQPLPVLLFSWASCLKQIEIGLPWSSVHIETGLGVLSKSSCRRVCLVGICGHPHWRIRLLIVLTSAVLLLGF